MERSKIMECPGCGEKFEVSVDDNGLFCGAFIDGWMTDEIECPVCEYKGDWPEFGGGA